MSNSTSSIEEQEFNYPIGNLTEYYKFDECNLVLGDLEQMLPKAIGEVEREIIAGDSSPVEQRLLKEWSESRKQAQAHSAY